MTDSPADAVYSIEIDAPIQRVWDAITNTSGVTPPMFNCVLHSTLEPGARMDYTDAAGKRCFLFGEVLEIDPPRRFVHTFAFGMYNEAPTRVEWELSELTTDRTRVVVRHIGLPEGSRTRRDVSGGWPTILRRFKAQIERGRLPLKDRLTLGAMGAMSFVLPKRLLKENTDKRSAALPTEPA
jgi:uncharacterized protein YndB with AHSA1/START domain